MTPEEIISSVQDEINPQRKFEKMLPLVLIAIQELQATKAAILKLVELQEAKATVEAVGINKTIDEYRNKQVVEILTSPPREQNEDLAAPTKIESGLFSDDKHGRGYRRSKGSK